MLVWLFGRTLSWLFNTSRLVMAQWTITSSMPACAIQSSVEFDRFWFSCIQTISLLFIPRFEFIVLRWESGNALSRFWNDRILLVRELLERDGGGIRNENERRCTVGGVVIFSGSGFARRSRRCRMGFRSGSKLRGTGVQRGWKMEMFFVLSAARDDENDIYLPFSLYFFFNEISTRFQYRKLNGTNGYPFLKKSIRFLPPTNCDL